MERLKLKRRKFLSKEIYLTCLEKQFEEELQSRGLERGIDYAIQYPLRLSFILDFAFPEQKVAVETDGEAYHPTRRDVVKNKILKKLGWKVLRFWGKEVQEDVGKCVDKTMELVNE